MRTICQRFCKRTFFNASALKGQNILVKPYLQVKIAEPCLNTGDIHGVVYGINNVHSCLKGSFQHK